MLNSFRAQVEQARQNGSLYFAALLEEKLIREVVGTASSLWQAWLYNPAITIWVFLSQCLSPDHSCRDAVARLIAWRIHKGQKPCSAETGAYCTARDDLPEEACHELVRRTGAGVEAEAPQSWLWHGRQVRVTDGTAVTMPDTPENQAAYPQQKEQQPGCGFPIARVLVVFSLTVGTVLDAIVSKCEGKLTGENSLFRRLHELLKPGDISLTDRCFSGWFDLAMLFQRGVDSVTRKHQARATDFRTGQHLGREDHLVRVPKPSRPKWMTVEQYLTFPLFLTLREVRVRVTQRGFRTKSLVVVTTLLDAEKYTAQDLADLYRRRWQAELNFRSLKVVLQMDHLRCKKPHRVRNEIWMHLIGYNLIRRVMALAALETGGLSWQISFKGTLQTLEHFLPLLVAGMPLDQAYRALVTCLATHGVGNRPDRYEPRRVKRRPKPYKWMQKPRQAYKKRLK